MTDSNGRKMVDIQISTTWYPDFQVECAYYEDDGSEVPVEELEALDNDEIAYYYESNK